MKNLFKIHPITYLVLISVLFAGYFNYFLIISFILLIHDSGHLIVLKFLKKEVKEITILPFGSIINSNVTASDSTRNIFLISIAGVVMQSLLYPIMFLFRGYLISEITYQIFLSYNTMIFVFNLLPIIPLDGAKLTLCLLELVFSYKKAIKLVNYISILFLLIFTAYLSFNGLNSYLIVIFLLSKIYEEIKNHRHIFNHFLLSRHLYVNPYKRIKYIKVLNQLYKNKYNFINNESEEKVLKSYYFW